ncbi:protein CHROMATIN REMODELING 25 [Lycium ferocissimum]|uniref:protein CHROMATIN REMODELING 25 n=1 Tax=Lycium ferocissimum TaxID=112874 RepID=UPI002815DE5A|nr:protein CHROMATIN REMODELING 25 [Lycium ferocissimum]
MDDQDEALSSSSEHDDSSDEFVCDPQDNDIDCESNDDDEDRKSQNVDALLRGNLIVKRQSLLPRVYSVTDAAANLRKPFKPPSSNGYSSTNEHLARRLCARKKFVPWGSTRPVFIAVTNRLTAPESAEIDVVEDNLELPPGVEPLVLWQPEEILEEGCNLVPIIVDPLVVRFLRPHQREGVQFMFDCVSGALSTVNINGCILADDMGLGKTLQSITLLYTLLRQGFDGKPMVKKAIIVTPTSLVSNWEAEISKWVGERVKLVALCESTRDDVVSGIDSFINPHSNLQVLIVSYETFRMHSSKFSDSGSCDLLICDEAHRLKNDQTLTNRALASLACKRRVLLSGTPMQNDLEEFYAMVNFTNPGILGDAAHFRRYFETPIICGREPTATEEERKLGSDRSAELSSKVNQFILRRTNALLSNHLPPKIIEVVCCKLTPLQSELYNHFIHSKNVKRAITEEAKQSKILAYITALKKLCNHPKLIYDTIRSGSPGTSGFEDCIRFFPPEMFSGRCGSWTGGAGLWVELSGKMHVLARLLAQLRQKTDDRIVLVSNYTQTLDLFSQLCRERRYPFLRLDGTTSISKRQKLVNSFNDPTKDEFAFLLSSKAGGCGLNLIGGNRLVLFDPDWNPANDKQAAARVWRDGQKKRVYIYRFLSTGTIEEKVYQRQMSKEGLQKVIQQEQTDSDIQGNSLSAEDLRDLFTFHDSVRSEIHENMSCDRCQPDAVMPDDNTIAEFNTQDHQPDQEDIGGFAGAAGCLHTLQSSEKQIGAPKEEDLASWGHHFFPKSVPDVIFQSAAGDEVSFVFTCQVDGKLVPVESKPKQQVENRDSPHFKGKLMKSTFSSPRQAPSLQTLSSSKPSSEKENSFPKRDIISQAQGLSASTPNGISMSTLPAFFKPLKKPRSKLNRPLGDTTINENSKLSSENRLPKKRLSPDNIYDPRSKLNRPLEDTTIYEKIKLSSENRLPKKRLSPDNIYDDDDDDFA